MGSQDGLLSMTWPLASCRRVGTDGLRCLLSRWPEVLCQRSTGMAGRRRYARLRKMHCAVLVVAIVVLGHSAMAPAQPAGVANELKQALLARSDKWADGAVDGLVSAIVSLQTERSADFTDQQVQDIVLGIREPAWGPVVSDWQHPLSRQRNQLIIVQAIRQYLELGRGDDLSRAKALAQAKEMLRKRRDVLAGRHPQHKEAISRAMDAALKSVNVKAGNRLRRLCMVPVSDEILQMTHARWETRLARFPAGEKDPDRLLFLVRSLLLSARGAFTRASQGPTLPSSPALVQAEDLLMKNMSEVSEWERKAHDRMVDEKARKAEEKARLVDIGASPRDARSELDRSVAMIDVAGSEQASRGDSLRSSGDAESADPAQEAEANRAGSEDVATGQGGPSATGTYWLVAIVALLLAIGVILVRRRNKGGQVAASE